MNIVSSAQMPVLATIFFRLYEQTAGPNSVFYSIPGRCTPESRSPDGKPARCSVESRLQGDEASFLRHWRGLYSASRTRRTDRPVLRLLSSAGRTLLAPKYTKRALAALDE